MIGLVRMLARGASRRERVRGRLMVAGAALATLLLCLAMNLLAFGFDRQVGYLGDFSVPDRRAVTALALALLVVPAAAFVHQVSRLGGATRERRLAALRLAGATPRDLRVLGAYEGGRQALLGGVCGVVAFLAVRLVASWTLGGDVPPVSAVLLVMVLALLTFGGAVSGLKAGRHVVASPLGVVRRQPATGPRARDLLLVLGGAGLLVAGLTGKGKFPLGSAYGAALSMVTGAVLVLFGLVLGAAWLIRLSARRVIRRTGTAETLLAARMVEADPRGWARALSVVALTVFFGAASGVLEAERVAQDAFSGFHVKGFLLVDLALLIALLTSGAALVVHQSEELLDHRRSFATLSAVGVPERGLGRVLTRQALIASLPVCVVAAVGGVTVVVLMVLEAYEATPVTVVLVTGKALLMTGIGVLAATLVARAARPMLRAALRPEELRAD